MKKLTSLLMILCLAAFTVGCGDQTADTTTDKTPADNTAETDEVDNDGDGQVDEAGETGEGEPAKPAPAPEGEA